MIYSYHPVYYGEKEDRYRAIVIDNGKIVHDRIFNKEEESKTYVSLCKKRQSLLIGYDKIS